MTVQLKGVPLDTNKDSHAAGVFPLSCVSAAASYDVHQRERTD